jgi:hypothetical protein
MWPMNVSHEGPPPLEGFVIFSENAHDSKTTDFNAKALKDLHGNASIAKVGISLFHLQHEINERLGRRFASGFVLRFTRIE